MTPTFAAVASGKVAVFAGAQIRGTIPVRQSFLNKEMRQAISERGGRVKDVDIRIGSNNLIECGVRIGVGPFAKWFRPQMIVTPKLLSNRGAFLVLTVASSEYVGLMWIAQVFANEYFPRGLTVDGRQITVDLKAVVPSPAAGALMRNLRDLAVRTTPGLIVIDFDLKIEET